MTTNVASPIGRLRTWWSERAQVRDSTTGHVTWRHIGWPARGPLSKVGIAAVMGSTIRMRPVAAHPATRRHRRGRTPGLPCQRDGLAGGAVRGSRDLAPSVGHGNPGTVLPVDGEGGS